MKGKLLIFSAPSGSGKTTIVKYLMGLNLDLEFSVSATSRAKRPNEINGKDYYFLTVNEFRAKISAGEFIEWEEVYAGQFYGTLRSEVERIRNKGCHVVFDVDVVGGLNIKSQFGNDALSVFVMAPSLEILKQRLRARLTEDEASFQKRFLKAAKESEFADKFDVILLNDKLENTLLKVKEIVTGFLTT